MLAATRTPAFSPSVTRSKKDVGIDLAIERGEVVDAPLRPGRGSDGEQQHVWPDAAGRLLLVAVAAPRAARTTRQRDGGVPRVRCSTRDARSLGRKGLTASIDSGDWQSHPLDSPRTHPKRAVRCRRRRLSALRRLVLRPHTLRRLLLRPRVLCMLLLRPHALRLLPPWPHVLCLLPLHAALLPRLLPLRLFHAHVALVHQQAGGARVVTERQAKLLAASSTGHGWAARQLSLCVDRHGLGRATDAGVTRLGWDVRCTSDRD